VILTHCPTCHHALTVVTVPTDTIEEVTVSWSCEEGHADSLTVKLPTKARPVHAGHPVVVPGGTYLRRRGPLVARR
jgi:hypothetical protein